MDAVQAVLLFVIALLTVLFVILGVQVFIILKEFRSTVRRVNTLLDTAQDFTDNMAQPLSFMSTLLMSTKSIATVAKIFKQPKHKE